MTHAPMPAIPSDRADDLHHLDHLESADLVLFMAGNQFMAMESLLDAFRKQHPEVGHIYYETLPPGLELKQILAGGARFGDRILPGRPDIYSSVNLQAMQSLEQAGRITRDAYRLYLHNRLALMVPKGNPARIARVSDLGRDAVRISQPDPANEDIARHIIDMYAQAGGNALVRRIMETKRAEATTILTVVHHRETPLRIARGTVDVGPVWATEIAHARSRGPACEGIEPGAELDQRDRINYYIGCLTDAPHPANARKFFDFVLSPVAQQIYAGFGFVPCGGTSVDP